MRNWERVRNLTIKGKLWLGGTTTSDEVTATAAELNIMDGITATTDELNIMDGVVATAAELNRAADVSTRIVTITATGSITLAANEGKINLLGEVGGDAAVTLTMPAATGTGGKYYFVVSVVNTSGYVVKVADATDTVEGMIITNSTGDTPDVAFPWNSVTGTSDTVTLDGTTTGGVAIGDWFEWTDIALNTWAVRGVTTSSGTEATPFSATVS